MKKIVVILFIIGVAVNCYSQNKTRSSSKDTLKEVRKCLNVLDSLAKNTTDSLIANNGVYCINYLAEVSEIEPSSDGTFVGYLYCTRDDLKKWHEWYDKKYRKKKGKKKQ